MQHETFDVHAHFIPQAVIQLLATAVLEPAQERDVIETYTGTRNRRAEQVSRNVLATPIVCPGKTTFNEPRVDGINDVSWADDAMRATAAALAAIYFSLFMSTPLIKKAFAMLCVARLKAAPRSLLGRRSDPSSMPKIDKN